MESPQSLRVMPNFHRLHKPLVELGVDTTAIYAQVGITQRQIDRDQVDLRRYLQVLQLTAELYKKPFLGLDIAQMRDTADLGLYGYMISNAPDYRSLLELAGEYMDVVTPGAVASLKESSAHAMWIYQLPFMEVELCRHDVELTLMEFIWVTRKALGQDDWSPLEIFFQHDPPKNSAPLRQAMAQKITFNASLNGALFPRQLLDISINDSDPKLLRLLQKEVGRQRVELRVNEDLVTKVSLMITAAIGKGDVSSEKLAHGLNMSRSSLHRRLAEAGTSIQALRDGVMIELAKQMLSTTRAQVSEIALTLGYTESSAFVRAFRRLTGETPSAYRKNNGVINRVQMGAHTPSMG